jgi:hypothetical protein
MNSALLGQLKQTLKFGNRRLFLVTLINNSSLAPFALFRY